MVVIVDEDDTPDVENEMLKEPIVNKIDKETSEEDTNEETDDEGLSPEVREMLQTYKKKDIHKARECKEQGNEEFRLQRYKEAVEKYAEALLWCPKKYTQERATFHNNKAMAHIKKGEWEDAIYETTQVLSIYPDDLKALMRRSMAYENDKKYDEAIQDWDTIGKAHTAYSSQALQNSQRLEKLKEASMENMKTEVLCTYFILYLLYIFYYITIYIFSIYTTKQLIYEMWLINYWESLVCP